MDWADEIAKRLTDEWTYSSSTDSSSIAAALRKAKADGMREAAAEVKIYKTSTVNQMELSMRLRIRAEAIEKGME